jgi:hypothetical protein
MPGVSEGHDLGRDPELPNNVVSNGALDDLVGLSVLVARNNDEMRAVLSDALVFGNGHADSLNAADVGALAQPVRDRPKTLEVFVDVLNAFVDLPEQRFVLGGSNSLLVYRFVISQRAPRSVAPQYRAFEPTLPQATETMVSLG